MTWRITWTNEALAEFADLDRAVAQRISTKLDGVLTDPPRFFSRLKGSYLWRLRVGDYRVIAKFHQEMELVEIRKVGNRSIVYDR